MSDDEDAMKTLLFAAALILGGCATAVKVPPVMEIEKSRMRTATPPESQKDAEAMVIAFFAETLKDPESARYTFRPIKRGWITARPNIRWFGWFICGTINAKNSYGGYVGRRPFIVHFHHDGNGVLEGQIQGRRNYRVRDWCSYVYKTKNYINPALPRTS